MRGRRVDALAAVRRDVPVPVALVAVLQPAGDRPPAGAAALGLGGEGGLAAEGHVGAARLRRGVLLQLEGHVVGAEAEGRHDVLLQKLLRRQPAGALDQARAPV